VARNITVTHNICDKSEYPSSLLLDSEQGFIIKRGVGGIDTNFSFNILNDNRHSEQDALGSVNYATTVEKTGNVIFGNTVNYSGGYGIDVSTGDTVVGNHVTNSGNEAIAVLTDVSESINNVVVSSNIVTNANVDDIGFFSGIIVMNSGGAIPGQSVFDNITISDNTVIDNRGTKLTDYGVRFSAEYTSFNNVIVSGNNLVNVEVESIYFQGGTDSKYSNMSVFENLLKDNPTTLNTSTTPSILGQSPFKTSSTSARTLTDFLGGDNGDMITIVFNDANTTINSNANLYLKTSGTRALGDTLTLVRNNDVWREVSKNLSSPPPIGDVIQNTGEFTTIDASSSIVALGASRIMDTSFNPRVVDIGQNASGDGQAMLDFHSTATPIDYNLRILRAPGVNGTAQIQQLGTGGVEIWSNGIKGMTIDSTGHVTFHQGVTGDN